MKSFSLISIVLLAVSFSRAQDSPTCSHLCSCDKIMAPAGLQFSHIHNKKEWMFSYRNMFMNMKGLQQGNKNYAQENLQNAYLMSPSGMYMDMHMLMTMVGITDKLTVMGMLSFYEKQMSMQMLNSAQQSHHHVDMSGMSSETVRSSGIGDSRLYLMYGLVKSADQQLIVGTGVNVPSGNINCTGLYEMYSGGRLPYNMQAGCGTWAFLPALGYLKSSGDLNYGIQFSSVLHQGLNRYGYRWGNSVKLEPWLTWCPRSGFALSARVEANFEQSICGHDASFYFYSEPGTNTANYGGKKVFAFAGGTFKLNRAGNFRAAFEYGLPIYQYANGIQMRIRQSVNSSISFYF